MLVFLSNNGASTAARAQKQQVRGRHASAPRRWCSAAANNNHLRNDDIAFLARQYDELPLNGLALRGYEYEFERAVDVVLADALLVRALIVGGAVERRLLRG